MVGGSIDEKKIAIWGLTFKANTDDLRDSPAVKIVSRLLALGARVNCYDPATFEIPAQIIQANISRSASESCEDAELLVVLTEWLEFGLVQATQVAESMSSLKVFDCRNILNRDKWINAGFSHHGLGR